MHRPHRSRPRYRHRSGPTGRARNDGWLLTGIFAIPFVAVTSAARLGDVASRTGGADAGVALGAVLAGVAAAFVVAGLLRTVRAGARVLHRLSVATNPVPGRHPVSACRWIPSVPTARVAVALVPAATGRRGPPGVV